MSYNYNNSRAEGYAEEDEYVFNPLPLPLLSIILSVLVAAVKQKTHLGSWQWSNAHLAYYLVGTPHTQLADTSSPSKSMTKYSQCTIKANYLSEWSTHSDEFAQISENAKDACAHLSSSWTLPSLLGLIKISWVCRWRCNTLFGLLYCLI